MENRLIFEGMTYYIETYGCQMNEHDSEKIAGIFEEMGITAAVEKAQADIVFFNTCCVRENAELKLYGNIGAMKNIKRKRPDMIIGVCGCMMQEDGTAVKLSKTFPFVDIVFGTNSMQDIPSMIYSAKVLKQKTVIEKRPFGNIIEDIPVKRNQPPLSYVSIMQGCNNFCSYCIVPYVRGRERSREPEDILREIRGLSCSGYKEVMLLGQNVNSYGSSTGTGFPELLERIASETGIERIRFMTSHPKDISPDLLRVMASHDNICKQLHFPVQSGSDRILELMNRRSTVARYRELVRSARELMPGCSVSTDLIVGFPGETDEDFERTMELVEDIRFDAAYMFVYSPRMGTRAAQMPDQIADDVKKQRITRLVNRQNDIVYENNLKKIGSKERILVEGISKRSQGEVSGRTDDGRMTNFAGTSDMIGSFINVRITGAKRSTLTGKIIED